MRPVGLCVRTARDGYQVLEARLMQSSGDPKFDAAALQIAMDSSVPQPNQRKWFEWLQMWVDHDLHRRQTPEPQMGFDCSALDREARARANVR